MAGQKSGSVRKNAQTQDFDPDLEWLLGEGAVAMRERGTLASIIGQLEIGGHPGGIPNTDLYTDAQVGWARHAIGDIERHRWLSSAMAAISEPTRVILRKRYAAPLAAYRSDQGFGARDKCPAVEVLQSDLKRDKQSKLEPTGGRHLATRTGVESSLGNMATLAFHITKRPEELLRACRDAGYKPRKKVIREELRDAHKANREAHAVWFTVKAFFHTRRNAERLRAPAPPSEVTA